MDQSWPHLPDPCVDGDDPISVNDGINMEFFPTTMTSTMEVLKRLNKLGHELAYICKQDWEVLLNYLLLILVFNFRMLISI